ncbi:uncharacterized protein LOC121754887 [Salvia splendens]|uniref:uncharacterized protein LOC121754887 n=1 Tax=Salvia splendens TaxID=180675 RepID=UPI001C25E387|nr:uncharacterized protein LOC121754887 [Salvia splendens]
MSSHFMIWNAQGIANATTQGSFKNMIDMYSVLFAAVLEPQTEPHPSFFSRRFGLQFRCSNTNGKIWIFSHRDWQVDVIDDSEQVLHVRVTAAIFPTPIFLSVVYAKCSREGRYDLWNKLRDISLATDGAPWLVGGDFNIFLLEEERRGSTTDRHGEMMDFADAVADCQLLDPGFDGPPFTWTRSGLWERLDRVLLGEHWTTVFAATRVTHLPRISSDHAPLLVRCQLTTQIPRPSFRFQNMWVRHHTFRDEITRVWAAETGFFGMLNLQFKLSRVKNFLKGWNREVFGNIFERLREAEEAVTVAQAAYDGDPTGAHRSELSRCTAFYVLCTRMEEDFWKQKAAIRWAAGGQTLTSEDDIRQSAVGFFQQLLTTDVEQLEQPDLDLLSSLPDSVDREGLCAVPDSDEVRAAVFGISGDSASGPDDYLSRSLDRLVATHPDMEYRCARRAPAISHLSYADDIVIFVRAHRQSVERLVHCLDHYSAVSGQMVNKGKSHFYLFQKFDSWAAEVAEVLKPFEYWMRDLEQILARLGVRLTLRRDGV